MHLVIDGYGCDPTQLSDPERVRTFLDTYPDAINMTKIMTPSVQTYRGPVPEDWGVSGFVIIAESHISVHTFPDRAYMNVDVFSCKDFDAEQAEREIRGHFTMSSTRTWVLERGLEHLDPVTAERVVAGERETVRQRV